MCLCVCLKLYYGGVPYYYYSIHDDRHLERRDLRRTDTILTDYDRQAVAMHGEALASDMGRHLFRTWGGRGLGHGETLVSDMRRHWPRTWGDICFGHGEALASDMGRHLFRTWEALASDMGRHLFRT